MIPTYDRIPELTDRASAETPYTEPTQSRRSVLDGHVIRVEVQEVGLADGRTATRELVFHHGGAAVVPIDREGYVYLVRQYRKAVEAFLTEIPAGKLDGPEDPRAAAIRELGEETGFLAGSVRHLGTIIPTAGYCSEKIHCYLATDLVPGDAHPDPDEVVSVFRVPFDRALEAVRSGALQDGKTCYALMMADACRTEWEVTP